MSTATRDARPPAHRRVWRPKLARAALVVAAVALFAVLWTLMLFLFVHGLGTPAP